MVELESEGVLTRAEVADFLREFADELAGRAGGSGSVDQVEEVDRQEIGTGDERREDTETQPAADHERLTLIVGGDSATVTVPDAVNFDVEVESRSPMLSSGVNQGIEFELSWKIEDPDQLNEDWLEVE